MNPTATPETDRSGPTPWTVIGIVIVVVEKIVTRVLLKRVAIPMRSALLVSIGYGLSVSLLVGLVVLSCVLLIKRKTLTRKPSMIVLILLLVYSVFKLGAALYFVILA